MPKHKMPTEAELRKRAPHIYRQIVDYDKAWREEQRLRFEAQGREG